MRCLTQNEPSVHCDGLTPVRRCRSSKAAARFKLALHCDGFPACAVGVRLGIGQSMAETFAPP